MKREPVVLPLSILAGLAFLFAGVGGVTALNGYPIVATVAACGALATAAAQVGIQFWIRGQVTPSIDVAAYDTGLEIVAGPAAAAPDGTPVTVESTGLARRVELGPPAAPDDNKDWPPGTSAN